MRRLLHALASLGLLGLALWLLDVGQVAAVARRLEPAAFALAVLLTLCIFVMLGVRWCWIAAPVVSLPVISHVSHYLYATFANAFTPANIGGDLYRVVIVGRLAGARLPVVVAVVRERYIGLVIYLATYLVCLPAAWAGTRDSFPFWANAFGLAGVVSFAALVMLIVVPRSETLYAAASKPLARWPRLARLLGEIREAACFASRRDFIRIAGVSAAGAALWIVVVHIVAAHLDIGLSWAAIGAIAILTELIRLIPVTLQGIGMREGAFAYFLGLFGVAPEAGFALGAVAYLALTCAIILAGPLAWALSLLSNRP